LRGGTAGSDTRACDPSDGGNCKWGPTAPAPAGSNMERPIGSGPTLCLFDVLRQSAERRASAYPVPRSNSEFKAVRGQLNFNPRHIVPGAAAHAESLGGQLFRRRRQTPTCATPRAKRRVSRSALREARISIRFHPAARLATHLSGNGQVSVAPYFVRRVLALASEPIAGQDRLRQGLGIGGCGVDRALSPEAARERMMARATGSSGHRPRRPCWRAAITSALRVRSGTLGSIAKDRRGRVRRRPSRR
jgi:hypothetical protein